MCADHDAARVASASVSFVTDAWVVGVLVTLASATPADESFAATGFSFFTEGCAVRAGVSKPDAPLRNGDELPSEFRRPKDRGRGWRAGYSSQRTSRALSSGYRRLKLHEINLDCVHAAREAAGDDIEIMLDVNCPWSEREALDMTNKLTISSASVRLQRLRLGCRSGARLIPILATRHGRARPGSACLWTDILNPL